MTYNRLFLPLLIAYLIVVHSASATTIGFRHLSIPNADGPPIETAIWYPTAAKGPLSTIAGNIAFFGAQAIINAPLNAQSAPLVLLSHGYRGNWRNQNWLAARLASKGYVVAAPDHAGTSTFSHSPALARQWWHRPQDLKHILDYLLTNDDWRHAINPRDITAIGHSLGGWTVLQLAGAQIDKHALQQECARVNNPRICAVGRELHLDSHQKNEPDGQELYDARITRVVSLDLGLAHSFSVASLQHITIPVFILAAGIDIGDLPQQQESGYIAEHIPRQNRRYKVYRNAMHFSFMQRCKPGAVALLNQEHAGDGIICKDGFDVSRAALHQQMFSDIWHFMHQR